jgi:phosphatidylserine decarboxylase
VIYGGFGKVYGIDFTEMKDEDLKSYTSFNKFFTRQLKDGIRSIVNPSVKTSLCSPCDGRVLSVGEVCTADCTIDCVKGRSYRLDEFMLGVRDEEDKTIPALVKKVLDRGNKLFYTVIYLAPSDYHRFHSPAIWHADHRRHIAGYLDPVKPVYVNKHKDVFKNNERVNLFGNWDHGFFLQSFVGALNVGSIKLHFEPTLTTNKLNAADPYLYDHAYKKTDKLQSPLDKYLHSPHTCEKPVKQRKETEPLAINEHGIDILKGEEVGWFEMGSTIVLIFEAPADTQINLQPGQRLLLGEEIVVAPLRQ